MIRNLLLGFLAVCSLNSAIANPFRNLGFEEANLEHATAGSDNNPIGELLPGWSVTSSVNGPQGAIGYNYFFAGLDHGPGISLYDSNGPHGKPQEGAYFFGLAEDRALFTSQIAHYTIEQRGDVPSDTKSLFFYDMSGALSGGGGGPGFQLEINGSEVPLVRLGQYLMGADVSAYAGENVNLAFQSMPFFHLDPGFWGLDGISFSAAPIPEPSSWAILSCGVLLLLIRSRSLFDRFNSRN